MGLPLLLASGYLVFPLVYIVYNVIKNLDKEKKKVYNCSQLQVCRSIKGIDLGSVKSGSECLHYEPHSNTDRVS